MRPALIAPVMRALGVSDPQRSAAFYRNVLGFEIRRTGDRLEAISGPVRLELGAEDYGPLYQERARPRGAAIVFFETDNLLAMHAWIRANGGDPTEPERVNRVKMRVFEIRDPDGHALWFGQSYHVDDAPLPPGLLEKALPNFPVSDVAAAVDYYIQVLGFKVNYQQDDLGVLDRDDVTLVLVPRGEKLNSIGVSYFYVRNADVLYAELKSKGAKLDGEPVSHPWGLRDFRVIDLDGNELRFGQPFE